MTYKITFPHILTEEEISNYIECERPSLRGKDYNIAFVTGKRRFDNEKDMLDKEYELICKYHPSCNTIKDRPQNYNVPLTKEELESRKGNPEWCQCCLKRRVKPGYKYCYNCSRY